MLLENLCFFLVALLVAAYAVVEGRSLGIAILSLSARSAGERERTLAKLGPTWPGASPWLLALSAVLSSAFPRALITLSRGLTASLVALFAALLLRAGAAELRRRVARPRRHLCELLLGVWSALAALLLGILAGQILRGVPLGPGTRLAGSATLHPFPLLVGLVAACAFIVQGALYLRIEAAGERSERLAAIALLAFVSFLCLFAAATALTVEVSPFLFVRLSNFHMWLGGSTLAAAAAITPIATSAGRRRLAFWAASATVAALVLVSALSLYPGLVPSSTTFEYSLTIYNAGAGGGSLRFALATALFAGGAALGLHRLVHRPWHPVLKPRRPLPRSKETFPGPSSTPL